MVEIPVPDASIARVQTVATLVGFVVVAGIVYGCDRVYRRWLEENHPFAGPRAHLVRVKTGYRRKRANVAEVAQIISDVLVEVARATTTGSAT
jgi:hypothetical protein